MVNDTEQAMKGTIRILAGVVLVFGAVGTLDVNPNANLFTQGMVAVVGLALMYSGLMAMDKEES